MWLSFNGWKRGLLPPSIFYKSVLWNFGTFVNMKINKLYLGGWSHNGGGIGWGDHFLPPKFIKISFECWATSTKQLLNAGRGHQAPRKAAHSLRKEVEQNIIDKKRDKSLGQRLIPGRESWRRRSFQTPGNLLTSGSVESFGISEGNIIGRGKNTHTHTQNTCLTTTPSGEVAQMLTPATSEQGLNRKAWVACLG